MNIIIPLGGLGERFKNEGYSQPKPLIKIFGKEMIFHVLDNLNLHSQDSVYIIYKNDLDKYNFYNIVKTKYKFINFILLDKNTSGATETVLFGLNRIPICELNKKTVLLDCDNFYTTDILGMYRKETENGIFCFREDRIDTPPIYSYVKRDENNFVTEIKEKQRISELANTGCYCFNNGNILKSYCEKVVSEKIYEKGECYISCVIKEMLKNEIAFKAIIIDKNKYHCLGTPIQLKMYCCDDIVNKSNKQRICFDLDNTLVTFPEIQGDYTTVKPILKNIEYLRFLKSLGHEIIIYTARKMKTSHGNIGKVNKHIGKITFETLEKFNIPYDEIYFGKPYADFYIDDLAINAYSDLEKELGYYKNSVEEREFNQIKTESIEVIVKRSSKKQLEGEIYYYNNIPNNIKDLFPVLINSNTDSYTIEKIKGITLSILYVNESLSVDMFTNFLDSLDRIHSSVNINNQEINESVYNNYGPKLTNRYQSYDYSIFPGSDIIYHKLLNFFTEYETKNKAKISVIHGDPVFSNCILSNCNELKFIDMRGKIGNTLSIYGDCAYDYAKVYQSIIGYDEILLNKLVNNEYRNKIKNIFYEFIISKYDKEYLHDIKMITNSLIFTLIPLHDNEKCKQYYKLINFDS